MTSASSLRERLTAGLRRTREKLGTSFLGSASSDAPEASDWDGLEESLVLADVGVAATEAILSGMQARSGPLGERLREELLRILDSAPSRSDEDVPPPRVTLVVGVNGVGKTTTVAKLARRSTRRGRSARIVAADTFRAAAQEQLAAWAERIGVEVSLGASGADPASVVHDGLQKALAEAVADVFVDTAGRLHTKRPLMEELEKVVRVASRVVPEAPHETLLVMDATVGTNGLVQARQFMEALDLTGVVLTKMDGTAKGGVVVAIARELGLPVRFVGVGESMEDLLPFSAEDFVDALLRP